MFHGLHAIHDTWCLGIRVPSLSAVLSQPAHQVWKLPKGLSDRDVSLLSSGGAGGSTAAPSHLAPASPHRAMVSVLMARCLDTNVVCHRKFAENPFCLCCSTPCSSPPCHASVCSTACSAKRHLELPH